jgi:hypothetical protein
MRRTNHMSETPNEAISDVGHGGITMTVLVAERNFVREELIIVPIKCIPAAVSILHAQNPIYSSYYVLRVDECLGTYSI